MSAKVPDGKKPNDIFTTLPTKSTGDKDNGSLKIDLPSPRK